MAALAIVTFADEKKMDTHMDHDGDLAKAHMMMEYEEHQDKYMDFLHDLATLLCSEHDGDKMKWDDMASKEMDAPDHSHDGKRMLADEDDAAAAAAAAATLTHTEPKKINLLDEEQRSMWMCDQVKAYIETTKKWNEADHQQKHIMEEMAEGTIGSGLSEFAMNMFVIDTSAYVTVGAATLAAGVLAF